MYDPYAALQAIDANTVPILTFLAITVFFVFVYFLIAFRMALRQQLYVVPFIGSALFFWHDLSYVLHYDLWFNVYDHWWLKMWWFALIGSVALEVVMIWQVYRYGHHELWPDLSRPVFGALILLGTLGIGALWYLVKVSLEDELYFITFAITAVFSIPFHTAIMSRRRSRAGQSIVMELSTIVMLWSLTAVFATVAPFFTTLPYLLFLAVFTAWPLANVLLILKLPAVAPATGARELPS
jgi:hypothetical protein